MNFKFKHLKVLTALGCSIVVLASSGDRSVAFQNCLVQCKPERCATPLPLHLKAMMWTCSDDCVYKCSHKVTDEAEAFIKARGPRAARIEQFYGKWAFWRLWGMQEPASVTFSLLNLWAHLRGLRLLRRRIPSSHPMRWYYISWGLVGTNVWIWSSVFHMRDKPLTEKLDYFSAGLSILFSLFIAVVRLFHLYPPPSSTYSQSSVFMTVTTHRLDLIRRAWAFFCSLLYLGHVSYLVLSPRFDYGYNVLANVIVGLIHNVLWVSFSLPSTPFRRYPNDIPRTSLTVSSSPRRITSRSWKPKPAWLAVLTTGATALEVFDFPPWGRIIDAHSLWHLATAPIIVLWYNFLLEDVLDEGWIPNKL